MRQGYDDDYSDSSADSIEEWQLDDCDMISKIRGIENPSNSRIRELISLVRDPRMVNEAFEYDDQIYMCDPFQNKQRLVVLNDKRAVKIMNKFQIDHFRANKQEIRREYLRRFDTPGYEILEDDIAVPIQYNIQEDEFEVDAPIVQIQGDCGILTLIYYPVDADDEYYREDEIMRAYDMRPTNIQDIADSLQNIQLIKPIYDITSDIRVSHPAEWKYTQAIQCSLIAELVNNELTGGYVQEHFDYLQNHTSGLDLVLIAHKIVDTVNYLAWRPFQFTDMNIRRLFKVTSLNLRWKLPDISSIALTFKRESIQYPACGEHYYIRNEDVDKHIQEQLAVHETQLIVLHAIIGQHTRTVLDIDLKRSECTSEQWNDIYNMSAGQIKQYIDSLAWTITPFEVQSKKRCESVFTWYKTTDKISIRYSMGITCNVKAQDQILRSLKASHECRGDNNPYMHRSNTLSVLVKAIDLAVHRRGASYRLPYFNKIAKEDGKYVYIVNSRTFKPIGEADACQVIKSCLSLFVEQLDDVINRQQLPIPICGIRFTTTGTTIEKNVDQLTAIKNTMQSLIKVECSVDINNGFWQICALGTPYCPLCKKVHDMDNLYQFSVYKRKDGEQMHYYMNCVSRIGQLNNRMRIDITGTETEYVKSQDEELETRIMDLVVRRDIKNSNNNDALTYQSQRLVNALYERKTDYEFFQRYLPLFDKGKQYKEINQPFLDQSVVDQIKQHITCIRSPMGSNKTGILELYLEQNAPKSVLWLQTRKSYGHSVQQRLSKFKFSRYDDDEHVAKSIEVARGRIIIQAESINRCSKEQFDVLILDEFMSIIQQLHHKTTLFAKLQQLIESAKRVVILDAQLELSAFQTLTRTFTRPGCRLPMFIINHYQPFTNRTMTAFNRDASQPRVREAISKLIYKRMQTENVFVFVSSMHQQMQILQDLEDMRHYKPGNTLVLNSETPDAFRRQIFADVVNETRKYKLMITTSTLTIGVDINSDHFSTAIGIFTHNCSSAQQFIQGVHRPRQLKHVYIFSESDRPKAFLPTTACIKTQSEVVYNEVFAKLNRVVTPDKLMQYSALYQHTITNSAFSYIINAFQSMGYKIVDEPLEHIEDPYDQPGRDKTPHVPETTSLYIPTLKIYRHYLQSIGGQQVTDEQIRNYIEKLVEIDPDTGFERNKIDEIPQLARELLENWDVTPTESDQVSLNMFIKRAHILLDDFSERPTTARRLIWQTQELNNAMSYMNMIDMPIEMLVKATDACHSGSLIRALQKLIQTYECDDEETNQDKREKRKITLEKCKIWILEHLQPSNAQKFVQLSTKQQRDTLDRRAREVLPVTYDKNSRLPKESYLLELFQVTLQRKDDIYVPEFDFRNRYPVYTPGMSALECKQMKKQKIKVDHAGQARIETLKQYSIWVKSGEPRFACCKGN